MLLCVGNICVQLWSWSCFVSYVGEKGDLLTPILLNVDLADRFDSNIWARGTHRSWEKGDLLTSISFRFEIVAPRALMCSKHLYADLVVELFRFIRLREGRFVNTTFAQLWSRWPLHFKHLGSWHAQKLSEGRFVNINFVQIRDRCQSCSCVFQASVCSLGRGIVSLHTFARRSIC